MRLLVAIEPCPNCTTDEAVLEDHSACYERYLEAGGSEQAYDPAEGCDHWKCAGCELPLY